MNDTDMWLINKRLSKELEKSVPFKSYKIGYDEGKVEGKRLGAREMLLELDKVDKRLLGTADFLKNKLKELEK